MATNADFCRAAEERLAGRLDTFTGDWTDWWADGLGSAARFAVIDAERGERVPSQAGTRTATVTAAGRAAAA
jgi:hypothetical protein